jgi:hypothetical protein
MVSGSFDMTRLRMHRKLQRLGVRRPPADALARVLRIPGTLVFPAFAR